MKKSLRPFLFVRYRNQSVLHKPPLVLSSDSTYFLLKRPGVVVRLKKRAAYPGTYCKNSGDTAFVLGYGDSLKRPDREFLEITLSTHGIDIQRDKFATMPLFYGYDTSGYLVVSNEYEAVVRALPRPALSHAGLLEQLADTTYGVHLYAQNVHILREGERLHYDGRAVRITYPPNRSWLKSRDLPYTDPKSFRKKLDEYFDYFIATRLDGQAFAFGVSGGLDSATLPQYYARSRKREVPHATLRFPGQFSITQGNKLAAIQANTQAVPIISTLDPAVHFPLAAMITRRQYGPRLAQTAYHEAFDSLLELLQQRSVSVISTGSGGDELFGNMASPEQLLGYGEAEKQERVRRYIPSFLTPTFREAYVAATPDVPFSALPSRSLSVSGITLTNNVYLRRDIWPVSPFVDPDLYAWCQGLPIHFRANRNILRAYHQAYGFVPEIYNRTQNEHFGEFFLDCVKRGVYDELMQQLLTQAVTVRLGYVDAHALMESYQAIKASLQYAQIKEDDGYFWYLWLLAEVNARYSGFQGIT